MPSANPKLEKQASLEAAEPIRQAITVVEHRIRNLEKRKGKLESYKDIVTNGGELNADQKTAVAKYDEVQQTLEATRELYKQIVGIANDAAKQQKKLARKEALERMQQDIGKVREVLLIQDTLMNMGVQGVRDDFLNGVNGAVKLEEEELKHLDNLYNEVMLKHERQESDVPFIQQAHKVAEHYVHIVDGKQREVVGTTYAKLRKIITSITQCGYFDQKQEVEVAVEEVTQQVSEVQITNSHESEQVSGDFNNAERLVPPQAQPEKLVSLQAFPVPIAAIPVVSGTAPIPAAIPVVAQPIAPIPQAPVDSSFYSNTYVAAPQVQQQQSQQLQQQQQAAATSAPRINDVIGPAPNFFFLQESELDQPENTTSQAPPAVSHIPPSATVVAAAVSLNAPIPTQTFTNQSFTAPHVVPAQVMYQQQEISGHLPGFANANPPPPIPMPPSHQPNMQFNPQNPGGYQAQQQIPQTYEQQMAHQESLQKNEMQDNMNKSGNDPNHGEMSMNQSNGNDWGQDTHVRDWSQVESSPQSDHDSQMQNSQQAWGDQPRSNFRGRGGRRGTSNGYNRGRGNYQQNNAPYYRNNDGNYQQNGYQRTWSNNGEGNGGYNGGYKRSSSNQSQDGQRGERPSGMNRGSRGGGGGQFRGGQRGTNRPNSYAPRGKVQGHNE
ncbi:hypothetical protein QAD02_014549 [Eretmocerus hayati]|uniref:Uncharacterized protein n=1 Tax=Eretmocerus hayati TaxID=131215 RepID=A0ACC2P8I3_9HYME|nr:hypothetical protein QAD02_014549 [Eretmocerus hayati]